ncbi:MAG TPA: cytochrome c, partial [Thermoanaerobaculia bacterium]
NGERRPENQPRPRAHAAFLALFVIVAFSACRAPQKMADNPAYEPYEASRFFDDGMSARQPVPGTVARGTLREDTLLYTGKVGGQLANAFPFEITRADVLRGKERFEIYCTPCHGATGAGDGMIVQRGYRRPPSYHSDRLRQVPVGHFVDVMTNGFGVMPSYANQVPVRDRWLIAAYIKALQLSQNVPVAEVPPADRAKIPTGGAQ